MEARDARVRTGGGGGDGRGGNLVIVLKVHSLLFGIGHKALYIDHKAIRPYDLYHARHTMANAQGIRPQLKCEYTCVGCGRPEVNVLTKACHVQRERKRPHSQKTGRCGAQQG